MIKIKLSEQLGNRRIWELKEDIINFYRANYSESPFLILATPPCQGMSSNGMGKMLNDYRKGLRPKFDERNRLILPTLDIVAALQPQWVIFENVPNMQNTLIYNEEGNLVNIIDYIFSRLGDNYVGKAEVPLRKYHASFCGFSVNSNISLGVQFMARQILSTLSSAIYCPAFIFVIILAEILARRINSALDTSRSIIKCCNLL